jgi:hypothetical protein
VAYVSVLVLCSRTKSQLLEVDLQYRQQGFGKSLADCIRNECSGDYKRFLLSISQSRSENLCTLLIAAMSGMGCNTRVVNEVFCLASKEEIVQMKAFYEKSHPPLSDKLRSELSGEHEALILNLLLRGRGNGPVNVPQAEQTATQLKEVIKKGSGMMGGLKDSAQRTVSDITVITGLLLNNCILLLFKPRLERSCAKTHLSNVVPLQVQI